MRIKKFIAPTMKEGKALVIKELGEDAVILSSRTSKNPSNGEDFVEIVAAMDETSQSKQPQLPVFPKREIDRNTPQEKPNHSLSSDFTADIQDIKRHIQELSKSIKYRNAGLLSPGFSRLYKLLIDNEFPEETALEIVGRASAIDINAEYSTALELVKEILTDMLQIADPISEIDKQKVVFFTGTTGSGKTSSLVKIAVICKLLLKSNILIISADTYKVGGAEQLQTISSIIGISFKAVYSADELKNELHSERNRDLIFIDTTGRSQNSPEHLQEIKDFYEAAKPDITYLVLNATTSAKTTNQIIEKFSFMKLSSVVLSKMDEAASIASSIITISENGLPISYTTNGQKIPDDIEPASKSKIIEELLKQ